MIVIPTLSTERLTLRGPENRDMEAFIEFYASSRSQYAGGPKTRREAWRSFAVEIGHWQIHGFGLWMVCDRGFDEALGFVGLWYPEGWPEKEVGWILYPQAEGKGLAFEAAVAARDYAYRKLGWPTAVSYIDHNNTRSIALAERLGATRDDTAEHPGDLPCLVFRHPAPETLQ